MEITFHIEPLGDGRFTAVILVNGRIHQMGVVVGFRADVVEQTAAREVQNLQKMYARCNRCGQSDRVRHLWRLRRYDPVNDRDVIIADVLCDRHLRDDDVIGHHRDCIC